VIWVKENPHETYFVESNSARFDPAKDSANLAIRTWLGFQSQVWSAPKPKLGAMLVAGTFGASPIKKM